MAKKKPDWGGTKIAPDENLARVVGTADLAPSELIKKLWGYIKRHGLMKRD